MRHLRARCLAEILQATAALEKIMVPGNHRGGPIDVQETPHRRRLLLHEHSLNSPISHHGFAFAGVPAALRVSELSALSGRVVHDVYLSLSLLLLPHPIEDLVLRAGLCGTLLGLPLLSELLRHAHGSPESLGHTMTPKDSVLMEDYSQSYHRQWVLFFILVGTLAAFYWVQTHVYRPHPAPTASADNQTSSWFYLLRMPEAQVHTDVRSTRCQFSQW